MTDRNYEYDPVESGVTSVNQQHYRMMEAEEGQVWRQHVIAAIVSIGITCAGYCMGWSSPVHVILGNLASSPLNHVVTTKKEAWMGSLLAIGTIFGPFIAGFAVAKIGQKWSLICCTIPFFIGWILIIISSSVYIIYVGRVFWGLATGMVFTISPMYCGEIATDASRGALGSYLQLFCAIGFLLMYTIGPFVSYSAIAYVGFAFVALYTIGVFFMPESPIYHLTKNNKEAATRCLAIIRGRSDKAVENEIEKMNTEVMASKQRTASLSEVFRGSNFKALYISCGLMFFQQFCGIDAVLFYSSIIFEAAGASLDSSIATIVVGVVLVGTSFITPFVVDKLGRRFLLMVSASGTAISMGLLGMYFVFAENQLPIVESLDFLPVLSLVLFILTYSVGIGPIPWAIMGELLPIEIKNIMSPLVTGFCWSMTFIITRFFSPVTEAVGMGATFFMFGIFSVLAFFFTLFLMPETKGKSFQEIQDILAGKDNKGGEKDLYYVPPCKAEYSKNFDYLEGHHSHRRHKTPPRLESTNREDEVTQHE